jgi:hypothetical protein
VQFESEKFSEPGMAVLFNDIPELVRLGIRKFIEDQLMGEIDPEMFV